MHDVINFLRDAVERGPAVTGLSGCYIVRDGWIYARNFSIQCGIPWPAGADFTVPADALDAALSRLKQVDKIKVEENTITLSGGRLRPQIKRLHMEPPPLPSFPDDGWQPSPPGLARALKMAQEFCGDRSWQAGVCVGTGRITAFSAEAGVELDIDVEVDAPFLIPARSAAYVAAQGDPDEFSVEHNCVNFRYDDGRWIRAQFLSDAMPQKQISTIFEKAGDEAAIEITQEWREALADAAALSDNAVRLTAKGFVGTRENVITEIDLDTGLPEDHSSSWSPKRLTQVFAAAERWGPASGREPTLFLGPGLRGVVARLMR